MEENIKIDECAYKNHNYQFIVAVIIQNLCGKLLLEWPRTRQENIIKRRKKGKKSKKLLGTDSKRK